MFEVMLSGNTSTVLGDTLVVLVSMTLLLFLVKYFAWDKVNAMLESRRDKISKDLDEAAMVDGCNKLSTFIYIILPLSLPLIATSIIIIFLSTWSQFQIPLILASNADTKPIAIVTSEFITKDTVHYGLSAAAGILAIIPPTVITLIFRKYITSGMMKGSVKG